MNERARDLLVKAAMEGRTQITGMLWDGQGGACAMGILLEGIGYCEENLKDPYWDVSQVLGITIMEWHQIVHANNVLHWDFLTIARKFETSPGMDKVLHTSTLEEE